MIYIKIYNIGIDKYIKNYYNNDKKFTKGEEALIMLDLDKKEVIKANNDQFVVDWISREEEQKQYEEVMYEKGLNQGLSQGIEQNKIDVAKEMLELNMDLDVISKVTKLAKNEIESLRN